MRYLKKYWPYYLLILIILIGAFLRLYDLSSVPPGIYPDEAKNANDAIQTLQTGEYKLFYPQNNGREGLYIWLIALSFQFFGISMFSLKLVGAVLGILTIWATYLLAKEFLRFCNQYTAFDYFKVSNIEKEVVPLLSAGLIATSFWHINFSRIGFRAILTPLILSLALYFTLKAFRKKKVCLYVLGGIFWGLGFYTYIAFRLAYLILFGFLILAFIFYLLARKPGFNIKRIFLRDKWWMVKFMGVVMIVVMLPLILYFYNHPEAFISRSSGISVLDAQNPALEFVKSFALHTQMLIFKGDSNWRHNFSNEAQLFWPVAILFLLGFWYSVKEIFRYWRNKTWPGIIGHLTLFGAIFTMMLPAALTVEAVPHALRAIGMMPFVFIYAGLGFLFIVRKLFKHNYCREEIWPFGVGTVMIIIFLLTSYQFTHYFVDWGPREEVQSAFAKNYVDIGDYFNSLGNSSYKYLLVNQGGEEVSYPAQILSEENKTGTLAMPAQTTLFIQQTYDTALSSTSYLTPDQLPILPVPRSVIVPLQAEESIKNELRLRYPWGVELQFDTFWAYVL